MKQPAAVPATPMPAILHQLDAIKPGLVLGIDPGTAIMGYGLVMQNERSDGESTGYGMDNLSLVECGVLRTPAHMPLVERLPLLYDGLIRIITQFQPSSVAVEELFFNKNVTTALSVGQARGVIILAAAHCGLPIGEYTPLQVKQSVTGYGRADKAQVQEMVRIMLNLPTVPQPDDAADAVAIAICHIHSKAYVSLLERQGN